MPLPPVMLTLVLEQDRDLFIFCTDHAIESGYTKLGLDRAGEGNDAASKHGNGMFA